MGKGLGLFSPPYFQWRYGSDPVSKPDTCVPISQRAAVLSGPRTRAADEPISSSGAQTEAGSPVGLGPRTKGCDVIARSACSRPVVHRPLFLFPASGCSRLVARL